MGNHYGDDIRSVGANLHQPAREMAIQIAFSSRSICLNRAANVGETTRIQTHKDKVPGGRGGGCACESTCQPGFICKFDGIPEVLGAPCMLHPVECADRERGEPERANERRKGLFISGPNLSRSIDAVIRALNFIRSAPLRSSSSTYQMLHFLPRGGGCTHHDTIPPYAIRGGREGGTKKRHFLRWIHARTGFLRFRSVSEKLRVCAVPRRCCCNEFPFVCCKVRTEERNAAQHARRKAAGWAGSLQVVGRRATATE